MKLSTGLRSTTLSSASISQMSSCSMTGNCLFSNFISNSRYRNLFEHETFDWFAFNDSIISKHLTGKRKAIAIDPSYIPKSGKKTPWSMITHTDF